MEAKFTKGDWYWLWDDCDCEYPCNCGKYATSLRARQSNGESTPVIYNVEDMNNHDANLIAAAPEMYQMLKDIKNSIAEHDLAHEIDSLLAIARGE